MTLQIHSKEYKYMLLLYYLPLSDFDNGERVRNDPGFLICTFGTVVLDRESFTYMIKIFCSS
jgi:hypothetical protein